MPEDTILCGRPGSSYYVTVRDYRKMEHERDRDGLAKFINRRLSERYIAPVSSGAKNGFAIMACACLLIETFESFYTGWKTTQKKGRGQQAVKQFFERWHRFSDFRGFEKAFYSNVRCGILHQGETQKGWRVTRESSVPVFLADSKTINATKFMKRVSLTLQDYQSELSQAEWNQIVWRNFRQKMSAILENCEG